MHAQTRRQQEVLEIIAGYIKSHGYRPSYAVIARHLGLNSRAGIARIVHDLESQGLLTRRRENGHFYIDVGGADGHGNRTGVQIDWLDTPSGGEYREPWQNHPILLPEFMLGYQTPDRIRLYRVTDKMMSGDDINEDDVALIELRQFVRDGDCVVAVLNDERAVLRKYYRTGADIELRPSDDCDPAEIIRIAADRVEIKGVYRGLLRPVS